MGHRKKIKGNKGVECREVLEGRLYEKAVEAEVERIKEKEVKKRNKE